jgi:hypothetical protein
MVTVTLDCDRVTPAGATSVTVSVYVPVTPAMRIGAVDTESSVLSRSRDPVATTVMGLTMIPVR